jgi:hypothetical protein
MGVATALAPRVAPAPVVRARAIGRAPVLQVRQTARLPQRACDCGASAGFSGRCAGCDRVSLQSGRGANLGPAPVRASAAQSAGPDFSRLGIGPAEGSRVPGSLAAGSPVRVSSPVRVQAQLRVASPSDPAEQEALEMGRMVARMAVTPSAYASNGTAGLLAASISSSADRAPTVYRLETGPMGADRDVLADLRASSSAGTTLPRDILEFMEPRFGADFGSVRIHTDEKAAMLCGQLAARAFTVGRDIYFGKDQFRPDAPHGWELIAHELTHTIQQGSAPRIPPRPVPAVAPSRPAAPVPAAAPVKAAGPSPAPPPVRVAAPAPPPRVVVAAPPVRVAAPAPAPVAVAVAAPRASVAGAAPPASVSVAAPPVGRVAAPVAAAAPAPAATRVAASAPVSAPVRVAERAAPSIQRLGISDALNFFADKANIIPGFRMLTLVLGVNPINMSPVDRSAANVLRALIELIPGGGIITQALQNSGVFEKAGAWVSDQIATLKMTGQALKQAVMDFLGTLSWTDVFHLGDVWERAKRIFTEPIDRLIAFGKGLVEGILKFIKDAILLPLAKLAEGTKGWDLLIAVLGKNPITGEAVPRTAETLIGGFLKLIAQDEVWANMQKANAIPRAWAWFQSAMSALLAFVSQIPDLFVAAFKSLTIEDVVLVTGAFQKVASVFGGFIGNFISWAGTALWYLLEIIFDVVSPGALAYVKKTGAALKAILKDPLPFVRNLVAAAKLGFQQFADNFGTHLKEGLIDWLTGSLPGVYIPKAFSLIEFGKFALSVLGITWAQIRAKIVKALGANGETIMKGLETAFDIVVALVKGGISAAWELIKEKLTNLKDMVIDGIVGFVTDTVIKKAVPKLISLFVPGAGFISAIVSIYDTIKLFIEKLAKMIAVVKSFVDSIVAIAAGEIFGAASRVEGALAGLISLAISFLAGFLGLGDIASKVIAVVHKVQETVDKALDTAINWIIGKAKALFASLFGKDAKPDDRTPAQKQADLNKGVAEADALLADPKLTSVDVAKRLPAIKAKYKMTELATVTDAKAEGTETDHIHGAINPETDAPQHQKTTEDKQTNIHIVRSKFTVTTKWKLAGVFSEQHRALVTGQDRPPRLYPQLDRRHVISSQSMAAHYESVLNAVKWSRAKDILIHARGQPETVPDPLGDPTVQATAQSRHKRFFNDIENLFVGDASENRSIGAEKDIPTDWAHDEWLAHLDYIKTNYALDDSFTP